MHHQLQLLLNIVLEAGRPFHTLNIHQVWSVYDGVLETIYELFVTQPFSFARPALPLCALFSTSLFTCTGRAQLTATSVTIWFDWTLSTAEELDDVLVAGAMTPCGHLIQNYRLRDSAIVENHGVTGSKGCTGHLTITADGVSAGANVL